MTKLITPYVEKMDRRCPHEYHPTPQLMRKDYAVLNGEWDFALTLEESTQNYPKKILVPFPPESVASGIEESVLPPFFDSYANSTDISKGIAYPAINDEKLYNAFIPLPPLAEQKNMKL